MSECRRSRPTRARGLKLNGAGLNRVVKDVAPYAGAWIETTLNRRVRTAPTVAPYAGAWIETETQPPDGMGHRRALRGRVD